MRGAQRWWPALLLGLLGAAHAAPVLEDRTLRYENGPRLLWQRTYPEALGDLTGPLEVGSATYLGVGPVVYALNSAGRVLGRADLPGQVTSLDASGGVVRVTTEEGGVAERFTLENQGGTLGVQERVVFPPNREVTTWLLTAARAFSVTQLNEAATLDPTNPFVALRQAQLSARQGDGFAALNDVRRSLSAPLPFPAWVQLAARLDAAGYPAAADLALSRARRDAASRGLDPDIPISRAALAAYGNPSGYVGTLLAQNRLTRAEAWMRYLRELHPRFEGGPALYGRYAAVLDAQGRDGEAEEWRDFTRSLRPGTLYNLGPDGLHSVREAARLATLALLLTLGAALVALLARAWTPQGEDTRPLGGRYRAWLRHPLSRARRMTVAYASTSERLMLTLLAAALLAAIGGWQWANQAGAALRAPPLNIGTYGGGWGNAQLANLNLRPGPDAALLGGLSAQLDGDDNAAREQYTLALPDACARNNLGVIAQQRGDQPQAREQYRAALSARPDLAAAAFNLGLNPTAPNLAFQRAYRPGEARLCYPDQRSLTRALTGDLSVTLRGALTHPTEGLSAGPGRSPRLQWLLLAATLLAATLAFSLLLPRPQVPAARTRPPVYRLLGLLLPGVTVMDSPWGGMLLLAWAGLLAALAPQTPLLPSPNLPQLHLLGTRSALLSALVVTYAVNVLVFILMEMRHARRVQREAQAALG